MDILPMFSASDEGMKRKCVPTLLRTTPPELRSGGVRVNPYMVEHHVLHMPVMLPYLSLSYCFL